MIFCETACFRNGILCVQIRVGGVSVCVCFGFFSYFDHKAYDPFHKHWLESASLLFLRKDLIGKKIEQFFVPAFLLFLLNTNQLEHIVLHCSSAVMH